MWLVLYALRRPITIMVALAAIILTTVLALFRTNVDIFPQLSLPVIYLAQPYGGLDPKQMEGMLTNYYEYHFLYVSGIHHVEDVVKMLLVGARVTMLCSVLLQKSIEHIRTLERGLADWMAEREYESVAQMQGSMSQLHSADPSAFERAQYMRALQSYRAGPTGR